MAKRKRVESDSDKNESYLIKVPVHLAFMYEEKNSLFFSNKSDMIEFVKNKIDAYREPVVIRTRNKLRLLLYPQLDITNTILMAPLFYSLQ